MRCLGRLVVVLLVLLLLGGLWLYRMPLRERFQALTGTEPEQVERETASAQLADGAEEKIGRLRSGAETRVALSAAELESLLRFRHMGLLPAFVDSPTVRLHEDRLHLRARVPTQRIPGLDGLGRAAELLPDTAPVEVAGRLFPLDTKRATFAVDAIQIANIPLPARMIPSILEQLGRADDEQLPADALPIPLPPGAQAIYVRGDSLVLVSRASNTRS
jgi:hypothetical protein